MSLYSDLQTSFPPILTPEEEQEYIQKAENGDTQAKNTLIEHNLRLVAHIAKKYINFQSDFQDLLSIGSIGLIKAVNTYNSQKKVRLATYAARCIENEILMYIRRNKRHRKDCSLQDTVGFDKDGSEVALQDRIADDRLPIAEEVEIRLQMKSLLSCINENLTERERQIIALRYALSENEEMTQREIADIFGISRSYVSRIEKKALLKLKKALADD
ncbi:MAG: RNA polymerase sporulation sigma factor SigK [Clostridiales bacterium]|nr:RNA polymerase sporulation sigma factor SigK [Clostridiales bacterium]